MENSFIPIKVRFFDVFSPKMEPFQSCKPWRLLEPLVYLFFFRREEFMSYVATIYSFQRDGTCWGRRLCQT
ncbi:hypothetical protein AKJ57_03770 [candidate division MSBL1 archaeon SCGC-AAA259A05]|uniref:Uncharacterized protein n=1 Tax=candidate division MSBL1 archaeon SCGC-AAA259A05 TaxID=1698259 RepID=A0A133U997_9EURY|nr:hypothetical protein AKJ57_03770 [candidate division MSBL1 archaeon SCGC-AAA259A05]